MNLKEKVYLAGGMKSGWQDKIIQQFENKFTFLNPRDHHLNISEQYTIWDLHYVNKADIILAYMEKDNPSGYGLTLEVGYAKALNKTIILIDERSAIDTSFANRFKIVRESSNVVFNNLNDGLAFFERFSIYSV